MTPQYVVRSQPKRRTHPTRPWVGLCGAAGVGKDTLATHLVEAYGFARVAFADPVRDMALRIDPYVHTSTKTERLSSLVGRVGWEAAKRDYTDVRRLLQRVGTDGVRTEAPDFWVDLALAAAAKAERPVVFTDMRFPNEAQAIACRGGFTLRIVGAGDLDGAAAQHRSEQALEAWAESFTFRNPPTGEREADARMGQAARELVALMLEEIA